MYLAEAPSLGADGTGPRSKTHGSPLPSTAPAQSREEARLRLWPPPRGEDQSRPKTEGSPQALVQPCGEDRSPSHGDKRLPPPTRPASVTLPVSPVARPPSEARGSASRPQPRSRGARPEESDAAVTRIQTAARQHAARAEVKARRVALARIQRNYRSIITRRAFRAALMRGADGGGAHSSGSPFANARLTAALAFVTLGMGQESAAVMALEALRSGHRLVYGIVDTAAVAAAAAEVAALPPAEFAEMLGGATMRPPWRVCALAGAMIVLLALPATMDDAWRVLTGNRAELGALDPRGVLARQRRLAAAIVHENHVPAKFAAHGVLADAPAALLLRWVLAVIGGATEDTTDATGEERRTSFADRVALRAASGRLFVEDAGAMLAHGSAADVSGEVAAAITAIAATDDMREALHVRARAGVRLHPSLSFVILRCARLTCSWSPTRSRRHCTTRCSSCAR